MEKKTLMGMSPARKMNPIAKAKRARTRISNAASKAMGGQFSK